MASQTKPNASPPCWNSVPEMFKGKFIMSFPWTRNDGVQQLWDIYVFYETGEGTQYVAGICGHNSINYFGTVNRVLACPGDFNRRLADLLTRNGTAIYLPRRFVTGETIRDAVTNLKFLLAKANTDDKNLKRAENIAFHAHGLVEALAFAGYCSPPPTKAAIGLPEKLDDDEEGDGLDNEPTAYIVEEHTPVTAEAERG